MAQQDCFHALQVVLLHIATEGAEVFEHFAYNALGFYVHVDPRVDFGKGIVRVVNKIAQRFGVLDFLEFFHALVVFHALSLEFVQARIAGLALLDAQNCFGVLDDTFA